MVIHQLQTNLDIPEAKSVELNGRKWKAMTDVSNDKLDNDRKVECEASPCAALKTYIFTYIYGYDR